MRSSSTRTMAGARGAPPRPSTRRAAFRTTTEGAGAAEAAAAAPSAASRTAAARMRLGLLLDGVDGTASGQEPIEPRPDVLEIRGVAPADLGGHPAVVADVGKGLAHLHPVDVAFTQVLPGELA